ncbi:DedA family protein [Pseudoduganella sp. RAF53_2]|uniref:DedA family protein n=1 Tax=unclassified Pseudoduganella TaxID=2637179 RepID=UPI003F97EC8C
MWSHELMARYGVLIVFINVFASSLGLPLPATPTLMMAGAAIALAADGLSSGSLQFVALVASAVVGGALADFFWFHGGRRFGAQPFGRLLTERKIDIERLWGRRGVRVLLIARFIPGLAFFSVLLCGAKAVRPRSFVLHDCAGIGLWALAALSAGAVSASALIGAP